MTHLIWHDELPHYQRLLDTDGRTLAEVERLRPVHAARVTPLDADGQPAGPSVDVPISQVTLMERFVPSCRWCGQLGGHSPGCPLAGG